jgi:hypothetical protein
MKNKKDISSRDNNRELHGYQEWYYSNIDKLTIRVIYKHGLEIGYEEYHGLKKNNFYIR